ncbi:MAG: T9SS type A sorting domain-containing protein [Bacteroidetes bacterium]|nr:T9SS type A sorting domain-containing protein [Bacteroidota bacterium]
MNYFNFFITLLFFPFSYFPQSQIAAGGQLISVVYDFDGLDIGQVNLPDGDYKNSDMAYEVTANPLAASEVIGDRVLKLSCNWQSGTAEFGKATMRYVELNSGTDYLNFYFYNPTSSSGALPLQLIITEDDNQNNLYDAAADDKWSYNLSVPQSAGWQLFSVPLSAFVDASSAGNGIFDAGYTGAKGMILSLGFILSKPTPGSVNDQFYLDMICFSEGTVPHGPGILDLPSANPAASCKLGALGNNSPDLVPADIEGMLSAGKKLSVVNWFLYYANTGTTPNVFPGAEVQTLINNGYTPLITWEMMFAGYARLDPIQPRLDKILNGSFDGYIDAFANKIKSYSGDVIMRIFHEFEGDWYSWSLTQNNADPAKYIAAFRHVVDRFRAVGANNAKWMWCVNAEPKPYVAYNWIISCYPGDAYVDIVANDLYNHPNLGTPDWKSFRYTAAETYYYLTKYIPNKPLYICEIGSRERYSGEPTSSQTKGEWVCQMNRNLQTHFNKTKALIFFSIVKEHDWRINSSPAAQQSFVNCVWNDNFYNGSVGLKEFEGFSGLQAYPNPFINEIKFNLTGFSDTASSMELIICDVAGKKIMATSIDKSKTTIRLSDDLAPGIYMVEIKTPSLTKKSKMIKTPAN